MTSVLEFLAHKLNGGRNPLGYFVCYPENLAIPSGGKLGKADWLQFVERLDTGEVIPSWELLAWIGVFAEVELVALGRS